MATDRGDHSNASNPHMRSQTAAITGLWEWTNIVFTVFAILHDER